MANFPPIVSEIDVSDYKKRQEELKNDNGQYSPPQTERRHHRPAKYRTPEMPRSMPSGNV